MNITLSPAEASDKEYFASLSVLVYRDLVERQIAPWDSNYENEKFEQKWRGHSFQKIFVSGVLVGGLWLQEFDSHFQLREIQIHPEHQNRGIGTKIILRLIERCTTEGKELRLRVLKSSLAVALYEKLGFKIVGEGDEQLQMVHAS
jgi:ribosomal protein S18 acetylase RimI-like enzyme